jgi:ribonuclease G
LSEEILINVTPRETRVAVVENGMLQELHIERASRRGVVGNVYKGRVQRVMPGMQAAFVELGLERAAFLHASDILRVPQEAPEGNGGEAEAAPPPPPQPTPSISSLVHEGQEIIVQVVKDPIGSKGARLTTQISIPSRYLVLLPYSRVIGVSARIEEEVERARLKAIMAGLVNGSGLGYIVRTNAEGQSAEALAEDVDYLKRAWQIIREASAGSRVGSAIYDDLSLPLRAMRDLMSREVDKVRVDSRETFERLLLLAAQFMPVLADGVEHYAG